MIWHQHVQLARFYSGQCPPPSKKKSRMTNSDFVYTEPFTRGQASCIGLGGQRLLRAFSLPPFRQQYCGDDPTRFLASTLCPQSVGASSPQRKVSRDSRERGLQLCWWFTGRVRGFRYPSSEFPWDERVATQSTLLPGDRLWLRSDCKENTSLIPLPHYSPVKFAEVFRQKKKTFCYQNWMNKKPSLKSLRNLTSLLSSLVRGRSGAKTQLPKSPFVVVSQSRPNLCDPMDCSTLGFPVLHHLPEFAQTHVHRVGDAIQPSRPLSSPSSLAFNLSWHHGLL